MPRQVYLFDRPTRFVAGTVGQPGDRTFYLQASDANGRTVSVALEKTQVQVLADRMAELLDEVATRVGTVIPRRGRRRRPGPADRAGRRGVPGRRHGAGLGRRGRGRSSCEAVAATDEPIDEEAILSDSDEGPDALRVTITPGAARAFIARARRVVAAGRPACPLCSLPLDPTGHVCPRQNGYRR